MCHVASIVMAGRRISPEAGPRTGLGPAIHGLIAYAARRRDWPAKPGHA